MREKSSEKYLKLTPNLSVNNVRETVDFYRNHLGFTLDMAVEVGSTTIENRLSDQGEYAYAMVSRDEVYFMFLRSDHFDQDVPVEKGTCQGMSVLFYIDVERIDDVYRRLKGRVNIVKELETTWYGMREFYIKDCNGYVLSFAEKE